MTMTTVTKEEKLCFLLPCGARVVVQEDKFRESSNIIVTPDNIKRRPTTGTILAIGPDVSEVFKVGDRVLFGMFSGTLVQFKQKPAYRVLGEDEILCTINAAAEDAYLDFTAA